MTSGRRNMTSQVGRQRAGTRLERVLGVSVAPDAVRQWPQSGEKIVGRRRIEDVESQFVGLRLGVGRRIVTEDAVVVEWTTDYGDGRLYRNVSIAGLRDSEAVMVTDYWGGPVVAPEWRAALSEPLEMPAGGRWPAVEELEED